MSRNKKKRTQSEGTMQDIENQPICEENAQAIDPAQAGAEAVNVENAQEPAAEPPIAEKMADRAELDRLTAEANAAAAKRDEYLTMAQRVQADFENYRRRNQNVRKEAFDDGARAFATTLLSVMDNMERAIAAAADSPDASLKEGVQMVCRQMSDAFEKRGITVIDRKGQPFDPNLESAVMQGAPEDGEPGTVCEVLQKGYQLEGIVIRHAMVKVVPE